VTVSAEGLATTTVTVTAEPAEHPPSAADNPLLADAEPITADQEVRA
jgi:hypothetical protein